MLRDDVQLISVDDHVVGPAHVFTAHIDPKFRDRAPRIVKRDRVEGWIWEDRFYPLSFQGNARRAGSERARRATARTSSPGGTRT
jgi:hypothetical protein